MAYQVATISEAFSFFGLSVPSTFETDKNGWGHIGEGAHINYKFNADGSLFLYDSRVNHRGSIADCGGVVVFLDCYDGKNIISNSKKSLKDIREELEAIERNLYQCPQDHGYLRRSFLSKYAHRLKVIEDKTLRSIIWKIQDEPRLIGDVLCFLMRDALTDDVRGCQFVTYSGFKRNLTHSAVAGSLWTLDPISNDVDIYLAEGAKSAIAFLACTNSDYRRKGKIPPVINVGCVFGASNAEESVKRLINRVSRERIHYIADSDSAGWAGAMSCIALGIDVIDSPQFDKKQREEFKAHRLSMYPTEPPKDPKDYGDVWWERNFFVKNDFR